MSAPFAVISDQHYHSFSPFGSLNEAGVSTRLAITLDATREAAAALLKAGGTRLYCAGDTFHVRGSVRPSVLNPVLELFNDLRVSGIEVAVLAGNHDLEGEEASELGNAATALANGNTQVVNVPTHFDQDKVLMIPWIKDQAALLRTVRDCFTDLQSRGGDPGEWTLILHAPLNNVIKGIPDTGIDPAALDMGWGLVLSGHYHNHKQLTPRVWSIGALTHQTWGDVDSLAGYVLVDEHLQVTHAETAAPKFCDFDPNDPEQVRGNYARVKLDEATEAEILQIRDAVLSQYGARGCIVQSTPSPKGVVRSARVQAGGSVIESVSDWIGEFEPAKELDQKRLLTLAAQVLSEATA